ncbi:MAG: iron ABC transporter permease [Candidatus Eremiobacteraeota bacterium]|nr:iron ABC transporter permease [Candidatus Eremiobacteraeota bacterium]
MKGRAGGLGLLVLAAAAASLLVGGTPLSLAQIANALAHPHESDVVGTIVWQIRLPRICIAATVGASLALCGAMLQGMLRNPLADPYLTGVSAAAAAAIAIAVLAGAAAGATPAIGFVAGIGAALLVAALSRRGGGIDANRLILAGVSLSTFFAAIVTLAVVRAQSSNYAATIIAWLAGSMAGRGWHDLVMVAPYVALGALLAGIAAAPLNALRIGELRARAAGLDVERAQWVILAASSLLAASSVVLAGLVGFIGLIVPHVARRIVGSDARPLLPACVAIGAALCMLADAICRVVVAPAELPIGVLLAFIGVPAFLYLYLHPARGRRDAA